MLSDQPEALKYAMLSISATVTPRFHVTQADESITVALHPLCSLMSVYLDGTPHEVATFARRLLAVAEAAYTNPLGEVVE